MGTLSECGGATTPHQITHDGKTYTVGLVTQEVKIAFERKLFAQARDAALALKECMTPDEYRQHLKTLNDDYISGKYALESERAVSLLQTPKGCLLLCGLLIGADETELLRLLVRRKDEVTAMLEVVLRESFPQPEAGEEVTADADTKS